MNEPGKVIGGRYRIKTLLGEGSFGSAYLADDLFSFKRVVIKTARTANDFGTKSFKVEAEALSKINRPRIPRVYHFALLDDGRPYLLLEWVDGVALRDLILQRQFSLPTALAVLEAVAEALQAVHAAGFIHRDVKPSNILVPRGPNGPIFASAKLIDFGVLTRFTESSMLTQPGEFFGTPSYMAPEQVLAKRQSPATDIYGLGVLLFEMLFRHPPFMGQTAREVLSRILTEEVSIPSTVDLPYEVKSFLLRCLSKDPQRRPKSAPLALTEIKDLQCAFSENKAWSAHRCRGRVILDWPIAGVIAGIILAASGVGLGFSLDKWLDHPGPDVGKEARDLKLQAKSADEHIVESLFKRIDQLISQTKSTHEQFILKTAALALKEYERAKNSNDRLTALDKAVTFMENVEGRLPWYVRYDKLIAILVSLVGILSGAVSLVVSVAKMLKGSQNKSATS